jgi:hypothetical protein
MANPINGSQGERSPKMAGQSKDLFGNLLSAGMRYGIPLAYLGATQKNIQRLRKKAELDLQGPELMLGAVKDLPRPNFALPYQPDMGGSSLQESFGNMLARDSFQRNAESGFEYQNALNRQQQEGQILDRGNQQIMMDNQAENQENLFNAQLAANELLGQALPDRRSTIESIFQNIDTDIYNNGVYKDTKETMQAQEVIRNPERYDDSQQAWAREVLSSTGMPAPAKKRVGGKLAGRTKFSY